jgi:hypothetical protein
MEPVDQWAGHIRALLYPIQFEGDPLDGVDRVLQKVVEIGALRSSPKQDLATIRSALASEIRLAELIPQRHSEETIRRYLTELERRLQASV